MSHRGASAARAVSILLTAVFFAACGGADHAVTAEGPDGAGGEGGARSERGDATGAVATRESEGGASGALNGAPRAGGAAGSAGEAAGGQRDLDGAGGAAGALDEPSRRPPYAQSIASYTPGDGAGYGQSKLPDVVLGPPSGRGVLSGSLDVLSLGVGGEIVLAFGDRDIVNGDGPDFVVFENPFWPSGDASMVFAEPGEVAVSEDGLTWHTFTCNPSRENEFAGCAGVTPSEDYDPSRVPLDPGLCGGDAFDLQELGLQRARFVRIRDASTSGAAPSAGFDLDAVGAVYLQ